MSAVQEIRPDGNPSSESSSLDMIVVMGVTGSGKSYFINKLAGREIVHEGADLDSCTQRCQLVPVKIGNTKTLVIDTPGFDDTERPDAEILAEIAGILTLQYEEKRTRLKGVVYVHRISDVRYGRSAVKTFDIFKRLCGKEALNNVLLITSRWHEVQESVGAEREKQLRDKFWVYMLRSGSKMSRFHGDRDSAISLVSQLLIKDTVVLELQREITDQGKRLHETAAGAYVSDNLDTLKLQCEQELAALDELRAQLREDEREMRKQIQRDWESERARLDSADKQKVSLHQDVAEEVRTKVKKSVRIIKTIKMIVPVIPPIISMIGMFVGIPPGVPEIIAHWFGVASFSFLGSGDDDCSDN